MPKNLIYAHYPLRSEQQAVLKIITRYVAKEILNPYKEETESFHYKKMYQTIMNTGRISMEILYEESLRYGFAELPNEIPLEKGILGTDFCKENLV